MTSLARLQFRQKPMPGSNSTSKPPIAKRQGHQSVLPPPQFGLRALLLAVTVCAVLAALSQWVTPIVIACIIFLVLCVIAHVAGNAIGTRLRELGSHSPTSDGALSPGLAHPKPDAGDFAPPTRLGQRQALGWPIVIATLAGIILGAVGGVVWTLVSSRGPVGALNLGVGGLAFAVLGGIIAFAAFGFVQVGLAALRQASADPRN
jgi:hypothetical protein